MLSLRARRRGRPLDTTADGDFRIRARVRGGHPRRSAAAYLRVGVGEIVDVPVSFSVRSLNRSKVPCPPTARTDGSPVMARGSLVAPRAVLERPRRSITLLAHGGVGGEWFWREPRYSGYDTAYQLARRGHAILVVASAGYPPSDIRNGFEVCLGNVADGAHQVFQKLRSGDYRAGGRPGPRFQRIAWAGLSGGGVAGQVEAYSFDDLDALVVMGFADQTTSPALARLGTRWTLRCARGGEPYNDDGTGPGGYVYVWPTVEQQIRDWFFDSDPAALEAVRRNYHRDACGALSSLGAAMAADNLYVGTIDVPVLLMFGRHDFGFPPPAPELQKLRYVGSRDVTLTYIERAGHVLQYERSAPEFRATLSDWLKERGF